MIGPDSGSGSGPYPGTPTIVRTARFLMWIQALFGVIGVAVVLKILTEVMQPAEVWANGTAAVLIVSVAPVAGFIVCASRVHTRRRWVRATAMILEGAWVAIQFFNIFTTESGGVSSFALGIAVIVLICLFDPATKKWFVL